VRRLISSTPGRGIPEFGSRGRGIRPTNLCQNFITATETAGTPNITGPSPWEMTGRAKNYPNIRNN